MYILKSICKNQKISGKKTICKIDFYVFGCTNVNYSMKKILSFSLFNKLLDIIKDDYTTIKTMIVCINAKEAEELNAFLLSTKKTLLIHEKMKLSDIQGTKVTF